MILYLKIFSIFLGSFLVLFASWIRIRILHAVPEGLSYCGSGSKSLFFLNRCKVTRIGSMVCTMQVSAWDVLLYRWFSGRWRESGRVREERSS